MGYCNPGTGPWVHETIFRPVLIYTFHAVSCQSTSLSFGDWQGNLRGPVSVSWKLQEDPDEERLWYFGELGFHRSHIVLVSELPLLACHRLLHPSIFCHPNFGEVALQVHQKVLLFFFTISSSSSISTMTARSIFYMLETWLAHLDNDEKGTTVVGAVELYMPGYFGDTVMI